ncbi:MAG: MBL fold metallo-hydrolase [Synergistaceae bacterium]|jgi:glyoxylase-like metal-dependent hydrolase (beta-lactamase superfamily II)|nr:MBL fold metallo-hydrolase [Synergistaceae bacterium]
MKFLTAVFLSILSVSVFAPVLWAAADDVFSVEIGNFRVSMLSEAQRDSGADILIGASKDDIAKFIPGGKYPSAVAAYLVESPEGAVLIDTGFGREMERNLKSLGVAADDIRVVLITHAHGDHIGGLTKDGKPAYPNAKVIISKPDYEWSSQAREYMSKYDSFDTITPGTLENGRVEVMEGVYAIAAYGHTPGHTMFMLESGGEKLLIWGDLTHAMAIQMPRPGISVTYDADPVAAAKVRMAVLDYVAENEIPVAGMHVAYPGIGYVSKDPENNGGYKFIPKM